MEKSSLPPTFLLTPLERRTPSIHWPLEEAVGFNIWLEAWGQLVSLRVTVSEPLLTHREEEESPQESKSRAVFGQVDRVPMVAIVSP